MAIDTAAKRASVMHMIIPDGSIDQADRQTITWMYGGILASALSAVTTGIITASYTVGAPGVTATGTVPGITPTGNQPSITAS